MQLVHRLAQFLTLFALNATRYTAATWIVRHQNQITTSERDKCGQGSALVATLFFLDLNNQFLAFTQCILDAGGTNINTFFKVGAGDFFER